MKRNEIGVAVVGSGRIGTLRAVRTGKPIRLPLET